MKNLEDIIRENKSEFDNRIPPELAWSNISAKLQQKQKKLAWKPYVAAASIMLFMSLTWLVANHKLSERYDESVAVEQEEVQDAQMQFTALIEIKKNELHQYKSKYPELVNDFDRQLIELQNSYKTLLPLLKDKNKRDIVLQSVIENLQLQVNVLNQQIEIIKQYKTQKNESKKVVQL